MVSVVPDTAAVPPLPTVVWVKAVAVVPSPQLMLPVRGSTVKPAGLEMTTVRVTLPASAIVLEAGVTEEVAEMVGLASDTTSLHRAVTVLASLSTMVGTAFTSPGVLKVWAVPGTAAPLVNPAPDTSAQLKLVLTVSEAGVEENVAAAMED